MTAEADNRFDGPKENPVVFALWIVFAAVLGFVAIVVPPYLLGEELPQPLSFFRVLGQAIEKESRWSLFLLFGIGVFIGWTAKHLWAIKCCATMLLFPVCAMVEMAIDRTSHNLFPIEFIIYAVQTIPAVIGGATGVVLENALSKLLARNG